ncbi:OmpA family protein [Flavobacterium glaciei]|uniref:Outer membrane protein OmpA-like peptidoglycan-associated protein n=1 Tax=Flavobacterium glaciei TaxID=386300 RepID=A0A562PGN4_9FLAO|nr:OmpA family protein [Flavobacterium glaciei]RDI49470.1 outer membrane protein OmpA-like peptidoglycan-associated protein [Flavobacterium glaciei]TWI43597.1 outer membrane protein OmpA-like peptidoglycan-associated protein [Flavobacterium glaciei]
MKFSAKNFGCCVVFLVSTVLGYAQKKGVAIADKNFENYSYVDAIATYEKIADKGYKDEKMFQKLGDSYFFIADLIKAEKWYSALFEMNSAQEAEYCYRYSQSLKAVGNYTKADKMLEQFIAKSATDQRGKLFASQRDYLNDIKENSGKYEIFDAGINSPYSDYGSAYYNNTLLFASARDTGGVAKKVFKWNNESFTNLYSAPISTDGSLGTPEVFNKNINSRFHESTPVFTKDGQTMYFTRNNYLNGKKQKDSRRVVLLKLYKATNENGKWVNVQELPFNSNEYSVAHPALSVDEKTLYFASDMPGTKGLSDLFKVSINANDTYGTPENLGLPINTEARETFPYISADNKMYFASDGHPGLGGLDVFVMDLSSKTPGSTITNIGAPINSTQDDFSFVIDAEDKKGFVTSNREGGVGSDDIYRFNKFPVPVCVQVLKGVITDQDTGIVLANAKVSLFDANFNLIKEIITPSSGAYTFEVTCETTYYVRGEKPEYATKENKITIAKVSGETQGPLALEPRKRAVDIGTDLAKTLDIPILYFDLDKSVIRKDAAFELEKVLAVMQQYPKMTIDIRSHTDCRQTVAYNQALSDRRAKSTKAWLIKNGIAANRLTAKGYGESQLVNDCGCEPTNKSNCTEEQHQANRRSEFIIVSM